MTPDCFCHEEIHTGQKSVSLPPSLSLSSSIYSHNKIHTHTHHGSPSHTPGRIKDESKLLCGTTRTRLHCAERRVLILTATSPLINSVRKEQILQWTNSLLFPTGWRMHFVIWFPVAKSNNETHCCSFIPYCSSHTAL